MCLLVLATISFAGRQATPQVTVGVSATFAASGTSLPSGTNLWQINNSGGTAIATDTTTAGWTVSWSSSTGSFTICSPSTAPPGGYRVLSTPKTSAGLCSALFTLVAAGTPPPPVNLTATAGNGVVNLSWTTSATATSYLVRRATVNGNNYAAIASGVASTTYTDSTVQNGTEYYYVVDAVNSYGTSVFSNQASATPLGPNGILNAFGGQSLVALSWSASPGVTTYTLSSSTSSAGPFTQIYSGGPSTLSYTDYSVPNGTTEYYQLVATNSEDGPYNIASATASAYAGANYYELTYSGGSINGTPYAWFDPQGEEVSQTGYGGWLESGNPPQGIEIPLTPLSASGVVTATFTWIGPDDPPESANVTIWCWTGSGYESDTADTETITAADGLGTTPVYQVVYNPGASMYCEGSEIIPVQNPGQTFTESINPYASSTASSLTTFNDCGVSVLAQVFTAPVLTLGGATPATEGFNIAIGQQLTASIDLAGTGLSSGSGDTYVWTINGQQPTGTSASASLGAPFSDYEPGANGATLMALASSAYAQTQPNPQPTNFQCYFSQETPIGTPLTLQCVYTNAANPTNPYTIKASLSVAQPAYTPMIGANKGTMQFQPNANSPTFLELWGSTAYKNIDYGIWREDEVVDPSGIGAPNAKYGSWQYVQTISGFYATDEIGSPSAVPNSSTAQQYKITAPSGQYAGSPTTGEFTGIDMGPMGVTPTWPYPPATNYVPPGYSSLTYPFPSNPADPTNGLPVVIGVTGDAPYLTLPTTPATGENYLLGGSFNTFIFYKPPLPKGGTQCVWVPIAQWSWTIGNTTATYVGPGNWTLSAGTTTASGVINPVPLASWPAWSALPTGLSQLVADGKVQLSWSGPSSVAYNVYRATVPTSGTAYYGLIGSVTGTSYSDSPPAGSKFYYVVMGPNGFVTLSGNSTQYILGPITP